jgi:hypothetical protein
MQRQRQAEEIAQMLEDPISNWRREPDPPQLRRALFATLARLDDASSSTILSALFL